MPNKKNQLTKKMFNICEKAFYAAKKAYKNGSFVYASDSAFLRDLFEEIINTTNKRSE